MTPNCVACYAREVIQLKTHRNEGGTYRASHSVQNQTNHVQGEEYPEERHQRLYYAQVAVEHT